MTTQTAIKTELTAKPMYAVYDTISQSPKPNKRPCLKSVLMASLFCQTLAPLVYPTVSFAQRQNIFELSSINVTTGLAVNGMNSNDFVGQSVSRGDINGDGITDVIVGARSASPGERSAAGRVYVIYGKQGGFSIPALELSSLNTTTGLSLNGIMSDDQAGFSLASGDVNGDGISDVFIGAPYANPRGHVSAGQAYVVYGKQGGFPSSTIELSSLNISTGLTLNGIRGERDSSNPNPYGDRVGGSLASGDINDDGIQDVLIGASYAQNGAGQVYVVYGRQGGFNSSVLELSSLTTASGLILNGIVDINGNAPYGDQAGWSLASGDINGDEIADILIGAPYAIGGGPKRAGQVYVVYGKHGGFPNSTLELSSLTSSTGLTVNGLSSYGLTGFSLASGDVNGDGIDDILIGAPTASPVGQMYVVYGKQGGFSTAVIELSSLTSSTGLTLYGVNGDYGMESLNNSGLLAGNALASGDINGDGIDDVLIGARWFSPEGEAQYAGQAYVVYGKQGGFPTSTLDLSFLNATIGFALNGFGYFSQAGAALSSGDINNDGVADVFVGAPYAYQVYVVYGQADPQPTTTQITTAPTSSIITSTTTMSGLTAKPVLTQMTSLFEAAVSYSVGGHPVGITVADFNNDGKQDIVVVNNESNSVSVLFGIGDGSLRAAANYTVGTGPAWVTTADFNNDGKQDIAVTNNGANNLSVLLGLEGGFFGTALSYVVGNNPEGIVAADFNNDGKQDIANVNFGSNTASILLGKGDGSFQAVNSYGVGIWPLGIVATDFNNDGKQDIATSNRNSNDVSVLLGMGNGSFYPAQSYAIGNYPYELTVSDFNEDGKQDIAAVNSNSQSISILLGWGNGTFQLPITYGVGGNPKVIVSADFNEDGKIDLAVTGASQNSEDVSVLLGSGNGTFSVGRNYSVGLNPYGITTGDFNGDGKIDLATADYNTDTVSLLLNAYEPTCTMIKVPNFSDATSYTIDGTPYAVTVADFNGDGKVDIATADLGSKVFILLGNGSGAFQAALSYGVGSPSQGIVAADFSGDGKIDIAVTHYALDNVSILLNNGSSTFQEAANYNVGHAPRGMIAADFNRDGESDIATANFGSNNVSVLFGNGNGTFQAAVTNAVGGAPWEVVAGDFNSDGKVDIATANSGTNDISILLGNGDGTFQMAINYSAGNYPFGITVADFNGDGKVDLATTNSNSNDISILLNKGNATFQAAVNYGAGIVPKKIAVADFNGDGKVDISTTNNGVGSVSVLLGKGDGTFQPTINYAFGSQLYGIAAADFNEDEKSDIVAVDWSSSMVSVLVNTYQPPCATTSTLFASSNIDLAKLTASQGFSIIGAMATDQSGVSVRGAGDVNGDGVSDLIIGAWDASPLNRTLAGQSYVIYGDSSLGTIDLASLTSAQGFSILGATAGDKSGYSVSAAGDVNKDGYEDLIIGAYQADPNGRTDAGTSYVVYGGRNLTTIDLTSLTASQGFSILGAAAYDYSSTSVSAAGDVNKDGYEDLVIGDYSASPNGRTYAGTSYVIYGGRNLSSIDLASLTSAQGFSILGATAYDFSGYCVSTAGDVNKDGYGDLIIGAKNASPSGRANAGTSYVVYGGENFSTVDLANLTTAQGLSILGAVTGDYSGISASTAGDVNADGYADLIIGAYFASPSGRTQAGTSYVIYGGASLESIDLNVLTSTQGFWVAGAVASDRSGYSVAAAGDVNADGYGDVIIGAYQASPNGKAGAGKSYVIYGGPNLGSIDLSTLTTAQWFSILGATAYDYSGLSVDSAGDVNADGYGDLIIGAWNASPSERANAGTSYVIYGGLRGIATTTTLPRTTTSTASTTETSTSTSSVTTTPSTTITTSATATGTSTPTIASSQSTTSASATNTFTTAPTTISTTTPLITVTTISPLVIATPSASNLTSTTPVNVTLQSGGRTTTSATSWTGTIIGVTVGVVAAIGAGYLAYRKWRSLRPKGVTPTVGGIALDALERQDNDARQMNANPVYEGAVNDGQYEQPHRDTWASGTYDTGNQRHQTLYEKLDHTNDAYEKPHVSTWTPENYDISEPQPVYNDPDAPVNPVATSIEPWGFGEDV